MGGVSDIDGVDGVDSPSKQARASFEGGGPGKGGGGTAKGRVARARRRLTAVRSGRKRAVGGLPALGPWYNLCLLFLVGSDRGEGRREGRTKGRKEGRKEGEGWSK